MLAFLVLQDLLFLKILSIFSGISSKLHLQYDPSAIVSNKLFHYHHALYRNIPLVTSHHRAFGTLLINLMNLYSYHKRGEPILRITYLLSRKCNEIIQFNLIIQLFIHMKVPCHEHLIQLAPSVDRILW